MIDLKGILQIAISKGASDVHFTVGVSPKMRVNGVLVQMDYEKLMPADTEQLLDIIMSEQKRKMFEEHGELDLSFSFPELGRFRINAYKQRGSVAIACRIVGIQIPTQQELGIPDAVMNLYSRKRGLVLVTGPTGSGKSSTLAAIIEKINSELDLHVITLEDPIEFLHQHKKAMVNQREIGLDTQNYAQGLRAALREDPDVILVGEMRDFETISVAITAAETGHLVLSTLHTLGAANTVDRMIDVFPPHQQQQIRIQLSNVLEAVVSQQLVPRQDGQGRVAAFEVLQVNHAIRNLIREGKSHQMNTFMQTGIRDGMMSMDDTLLNLSRQGIISKDTARQFCLDADSMQMKLGF